MNEPKEKWTIAQTGVVAALTGLAALGTMIIQIPIPATEGYFNIGDIFVILAGLWLGPLSGFIVGACGPTIADAIGYPQYILATFVTKGLEGFMVGVIAKGSSQNLARRSIAACVGGVIIVVGYFSFQAFIYPYLGTIIPFFAITNLGSALVEILPNTLQAAIGVMGGISLWKAVSGYNPRSK